jgi:hypothetical protein
MIAVSRPRLAFRMTKPQQAHLAQSSNLPTRGRSIPVPLIGTRPVHCLSQAGIMLRLRGLADVVADEE